MMAGQEDSSRKLPPMAPRNIDSGQNSRLPSIQTQFGDCHRQMCHPRHTSTYHEPQYYGRMSLGGRVHPIFTDEQQSRATDDSEHHQLSRPAASGYGATGYDTAGERQPISSANEFRHRPEDLAAAETIYQFSKNHRPSNTSDNPPAVLEPSLSAGSFSQSPISPPTPVGGASYRQGNHAGHLSDRHVYQPPHPTPIQTHFNPPHLSYPSTYFNPSLSGIQPGYNPTFNPPQGSSVTHYIVENNRFGHSSGYRIVMPPPQSRMPRPPPAENGDVPTGSAKRKHESSEPELPGHKGKKTKRKGSSERDWESYTCWETDCIHAESVPPRKAVSQFFGRNKGCTSKMPKGVMVQVCRKHYQQMSYRQRNAGTLSGKQAKMVKMVFWNADKYEGERDWNICLGKQLNEAVDAYNRRIARSRSRTAANNSSDQSISPINPVKSMPRKAGTSKRKINAPPMDEDICKFANQLLRSGHIGDHKTTEQCRIVLKKMKEFSASHSVHTNALPLLEFHAMNDWPAEPLEPLIATDEGWAQEKERRRAHAAQHHGAETATVDQ